MQKLPERPPSDWNRAFTPENIALLQDPGFLEEVAEYHRRYLSWDELKYRIPDPERRNATWAVLKLLRQVQYEHVPFRRLPLDYSFIPGIARSLHAVDTYLSGTVRIHDRTIAPEETYIINSLMEEAIASSILEGAATTRKAAMEMLQKGKKPKNDAELMVLNNYEAMRFIREKKDVSLSPGLILDVHRIVTKGTIDDAYVGRFRTTNDIVVADPRTGRVYHTPPDVSEIEGFARDICAFANTADEASTTGSGTFIHPVVKAILLHYLIGYLHPFNDGNGRTARSIFYWYVLSRGYWLFEFLPISRVILRSKKKYAWAYLDSEYDGSDVTYFIRYNLSCTDEALTDFLDYLEKQQAAESVTNTLLREIKEINPRQAHILRDMMENPDEYFSIRQVMQMYNTVYQTARTDLLHLAELGYINQEKRGREYLFIFNKKSRLRNVSPRKRSGAGKDEK